MKSALELAMEKANNITGGKSVKLDKEQKEKIAEVRSIGEAKIAEAKIMLDDKLANMTRKPGLFAEIEKIKEEYRTDIERVESDVERKVDKIRNRS